MMMSLPNRILLACVGSAIGYIALVALQAGGTLGHIWSAGFLAAFTCALSAIAYKQARTECLEDEDRYAPLAACLILIMVTVGMLIGGAIMSGGAENNATSLSDLVVNLFSGYLIGVSMVIFVALIYLIKSDDGLLSDDPSKTLSYIGDYTAKVAYMVHHTTTAKHVGVYMICMSIVTGLSGLSLNGASAGHAMWLILAYIPLALSYWLAVSFHQALYCDALLKEFDEGDVAERFNVFTMAESANKVAWLTAYKMNNLKPLGNIELRK
jgi:hypothetical protein